MKALQDGLDVVCWPDADKVGVMAMHWLANHLGRHGASRDWGCGDDRGDQGARLVEVLPWLPLAWDLADEPPEHFDVHRALVEAWTPVFWDELELLKAGKILRPWDKRYQGPFDGPVGTPVRDLEERKRERWGVGA